MGAFSTRGLACGVTGIDQGTAKGRQLIAEGAEADSRRRVKVRGGGGESERPPTKCMVT